MLATYRGQDWQSARRLAAECRALDNGLSDLYDLYEERIRIYQQDPPAADWDGVYVATSK